jgi:hypothetical protein
MKETIIELNKVPRDDRRSLEERLADQLILLYSISHLPRTTWPGKVMLTKLLFLSELDFFYQNINGLHYGFFRYTNGPMSRYLYYDLDDLKEYGLLRSNNFPSKDGQIVINILNNLIKENPKVFKTIDEVLKEFGEMNVEEVEEYVYDIKINFEGVTITIRELPMYTQILDPLPKEIVDFDFVLSEHWKEDILEIFTPEIRHQLLKIPQHPYHLYSHADVFGHDL